MKNKHNNWSKTKKSYFNWLEKNELRSIFSQKILYENYSLWWSTNLIEKGLTQDNKWYFNLDCIINKKNILGKTNKKT